MGHCTPTIHQALEEALPPSDPLPRGFSKVICIRRRTKFCGSRRFASAHYLLGCTVGGGRTRGHFARSTQSERGSARWAQTGNRLRARRTHLRLSINGLARELGIGADQYLLL